MTIAARRQPRVQDVVAEQIRTGTLLQRPILIGAAGVLLVYGIVLLFTVSFSGQASAGVVPAQETREALGRIAPLLIHLPIAVLAILWPLVVWRKEPPSRRHWLWASPLPHGVHTMTRVAVHWVILTVIATLYLALWGAALFALSQVEVGVLVWVQYVGHALLSSVILYLLVSILAILLEHPILGLSSVSLLVIAAILGVTASDPAPLRNAVQAFLDSLGAAVVPGISVRAGFWMPSTALWLLVALLGCAVAATVYRRDS